MAISRFLLLLLLICLCSSSALAIGLRPGRVDMNYVPGFEKTITYHVTNTLNVPIKATVNPFYEGGRFSGSLTISKTEFDLAPLETQPFFVTLKLPMKADAPGESRIGVSVYEDARQAKHGAVIIKGAVASIFHINGLYNGKYLDLSMDVAPQGEGKPVQFTVHAKNLGTDTISSISAKIAIYSLPDNGVFGVVDMVRGDTDPIVSWYETTFLGTLDGAKMQKGLYRAVATVYYDGDQKQTEQYFRIGSQGINIISYPQSGIFGQIVKFPVTVESQYNFPYHEVTAEVTLKDKESLTAVRTFRTDALTVNPFEQQVLTGYLDLTGVALGTYALSILVHYGDELTAADADFKVTDANGNTQTQSSSGAMVGEAPRKPIFTTTNILIGVIVMLLVLNILWFLRNHRREPPQLPPATPSADISGQAPPSLPPIA